MLPGKSRQDQIVRRGSDQLSVLEDMYNSGFDGDIVAEFKRRVSYE